jgi:hypothetical protein
MPRKPADVCPGCRKNVKRGCIQCSQCECWFHFSCAGTTEDAANSIDAYHCKLCLNPSVLATVDNISPKQTNPKETDSTAAQPHAPSSSSSPSSLSSSRKRSRPESRVFRVIRVIRVALNTNLHTQHIHIHVHTHTHRIRKPCPEALIP